MRSLYLLSFLFLFLCGCHNNDEEQKQNTSENDVDAARNFIRAALDGQFSRARTYMIRDSLNTQLMDVTESNYQQRMSREDKRGYREASINLHNIRQSGDTVSIVSYSNSFKKKDDSLKVVKINGQWLVDLKYSFPRTDSAKR